MVRFVVRCSSVVISRKHHQLLSHVQREARDSPLWLYWFLALVGREISWWWMENHRFQVRACISKRKKPAVQLSGEERSWKLRQTLAGLSEYLGLSSPSRGLLICEWAHKSKRERKKQGTGSAKQHHGPEPRKFDAGPALCMKDAWGQIEMAPEAEFGNRPCCERCGFKRKLPSKDGSLNIWKEKKKPKGILWWWEELQKCWGLAFCRIL